MRKLHHRYAIYTMAKELGLQDRGYVGFLNYNTLVCSFCRTHARIGMNRENKAVMYCYKCGKIHVGHGVSAPSFQEKDSKGKVVYLHDHNKK